MKFILLEDIFLYEDIEGMKKYYPNIGDDMFMQYIELDPTYKQGSTSAGKYAKWILNLANKGKLENIGHVKDVLMRFEEEKKNLVNKDIMKYKSMEDLENALSAQSNKLELSDRQKERRIRNDYQDAELIAADDNWEVWIPHSYNASCTLGKGTEWCTAYSRDDRYYKQYTNSGDLIIFINKKDPTEKYQLHIETDSFMDKKDHPVDFISFLKEHLSSLIQDILIKKYPVLKELIDFDGTWVYDEKNRVISRQLRDKVKKVIISDDVTSIRNYAFSGCRSLTSITIPNNITSIGNDAFSDCSSLTGITIPNSVTSIGGSAFSYCCSLTSIIIPDSVTSIGAEAFAKCDSLTSATIGSGVIRLRDYVFYGCSSLTNITLGSNVVIIREGAFYHCDNLTNITFQGTRVQWFEISKGVDWNYKTGNYTVHCTDGDIEGFFRESFKMKFKTRLTEDLESMKKYYPDLDNDTFMQYIKLDPTYKEGSKNPGTYAKWILALATRNKGTLPNAGHIKDVLTRFEESKNNLKDKNISKFKTVEELEKYLDDESSYRDLSKRQELRQTQKAVRNSDLTKDASRVYEDSDWEIWIPHTYEASCKLGRGSTWCTASTENDYYYNSYSRMGDLYIIINKHNPQEKYQFHFPTGQYMNIDDNPIELDAFLKRNPGIKAFYDEKAAEEYFGKDTKLSDVKTVLIDTNMLYNKFDKQDYKFLTDPFEEVSQWGYEQFDPDYIWPLNDKSSGILQKFIGMSSSDAEDVVKNEEDDNEYYSVLFDTFAQADYNARIAGASNEVQNAVEKGLERVFKGTGLACDIDYNNISPVLRVSGKAGDFVDLVRDLEQYNSLDATLRAFISNEYEREDPYLEYSDSFDENTYNEVFADVLTQNLEEAGFKINEDLNRQEYTSANTSINSSKTPAVFKLVSFKPNTINLDYGGGRFDTATKYLKGKDVENLIFDPYNRSTEHNNKVLDIIKENGGADTATCSNVLNVIKEPEVRKNVIEHIESLLKPSGVAYFTVYEGTKERDEHPTKAGYQLNRPTSDYVQEIASVFNNVMRKGKLIIARN